MKITLSNATATLLILGVALTGCDKQAQIEKQPVKVKIMTVESATITAGQNYSGTIEEASGTTLSFSVSGTIEQLPVTAGQRVQKGQLIATVDETTLQNSYNAAVAPLQQAEDAYERMKQLHKNNSLPEIQWVDVQSKLKQAQSMEQIARKNLSDSKLYAPFSGVISERNVEVGQNAMPGIPIVKLVTINQVKVCISVPENEISHIDIGQAVNVVVPALNGKNFVGRIVEKNVSANPLSRSYDVKALIDNPAHELMPGMICNLQIDGASETHAIALPCNIVQLDNTNRNFVWINANGKAAKRVVEVGALTADCVIITNGLADGDEVIIEGQQKVSEEMDITIEK